MRPTPLSRKTLTWLCALAVAACGTPSPAPPTTTRPTDPIPTRAPATPVAPTPTPLPTPTPGPETFTLALPTALTTLDPAEAEDASALLITRHLYEGLTAFVPGSTRVQPALALSWETSADGLIWSFQLRDGVTFSDGTPFTAEAARLNFERWLNAAPPGRYAFWRLMFGGFAGETDADGAPLSAVATVTDTAPSALTLILNRPDAALPNTLAMPAFAMVRPGAWAEPAFGAPGAPSAGTGPFVLRRWEAADVVELERNGNYWGAPARPDGLVFKVIPDDVQRLTALQIGEVDGMAQVPAGAYGLAQTWPNLRVEFDPALEVLYLGFNQAHAPWGNADCRLAVALAVDRERYAREFYPGDAQPADLMQPPAVWGYAPPVADRARDVEQARARWEACLTTEGAAPLSVNLYVPPVARAYLPDPAGLGAALRADLAAAGISVTVQSPDWATQWLPDVQAGRADLFVLGWVGVNGDPDAYLCPLFCGENAAFNTDRGGLPIPPDEALADLLRAARRASDPVQRAALYTQAHARIFEAVPALPLTYRRSAWAFRADLAGTVPGPIENVFFSLAADEDDP
jgi:peptide/nickel transport system substrate-binding protein